MTDPAEPLDRTDAAGALRPAPVRPRWWGAPAAAVVVISAALVVAAVLGRFTTPPLPSRSISSPPAALVPATNAPPRGRALPDSLACHGLVRRDCIDLVRAALASLPGDLPEVASAAAWTSLLCDSSLACSPGDLALSTPRGSVVVSFADGGTEAWLNVVDRRVGDRPVPVTQAWIVAWVAPPVARPSPSADARSLP